jgi:hypothetical protein
MRLQRLLPSLIEDFGAERPAEESRACADFMLQPSDDAPVRSFVLTRARRNAPGVPARRTLRRPGLKLS